MEKLFELGRQFRNNLPVAGSEEMIVAITAMVTAFDAITTVDLSGDENSRARAINALSGMKHVKKVFEAQDWERLGRNPFLYGLTGR